jgi:hypothetical protein
VAEEIRVSVRKVDRQVPVVGFKQTALCLVCKDTVVAMKDYNFKRHYELNTLQYAVNLKDYFGVINDTTIEKSTFRSSIAFV